MSLNGSAACRPVFRVTRFSLCVSLVCDISERVMLSNYYSVHRLLIVLLVTTFWRHLSTSILANCTFNVSSTITLALQQVRDCCVWISQKQMNVRDAPIGL